MDWYDIDEILLDGTVEEIKKLKCPDCGGVLEFNYTPYKSSKLGDLRVFCHSCNQYEALHKLMGEPNCVKYLGAKGVLEDGKG